MTQGLSAGAAATVTGTLKVWGAARTSNIPPKIIRVNTAVHDKLNALKEAKNDKKDQKINALLLL